MGILETTIMIFSCIKGLQYFIALYYLGISCKGTEFSWQAIIIPYLWDGALMLVSPVAYSMLWESNVLNYLPSEPSWIILTGITLDLDWPRPKGILI